MMSFKEFCTELIGGISAPINEATFESRGATDDASYGEKFEVKSGSTNRGPNPAKHDVYHQGTHVGHVKQYSEINDKKNSASGDWSKKWSVHVNAGQHTQKSGGHYAKDGFKTKKDALQHLADVHTSNSQE